MRNLRNPYTGGILAGAAGVVAINIIEYFMRILNISQTTLWEAGGSIFLSEQALKTPLGMAIGFASHILVALALGIIITYYISYTGRDYAILKGLSVSLLTLFATLGWVFPMRKIGTSMQDSPKDVLSAFIDHIVFALVVAYIIKVIYAHEETNPDKIHQTFLAPVVVKKVLFVKRKSPLKKPLKIK